MCLDSDVLTSLFPLCGLRKCRNFEGILTVTVMHNEGYMIQHGINVRTIVRFEINLSLLLSWMVMMKGDWYPETRHLEINPALKREKRKSILHVSCVTLTCTQEEQVNSCRWTIMLSCYRGIYPDSPFGHNIGLVKKNLTPTRKEPPEAVQDTCVHCPCSRARCMEGRLGQRGTIVTSPCQWRFVVVFLKKKKRFFAPFKTSTYKERGRLVMIGSKTDILYYSSFVLIFCHDWHGLIYLHDL